MTVQPLRIVYIGCLDFSLHCLKQVLANGAGVAAVFTLPAERAGFHADFADLTPVAEKHGIPVHYVRNINDPPVVDRIRRYAPDVIFVWGWSQLLKRELLSVPRLGCVGSHPALLPQNRGRHPLIWALVLGLKRSGLTFFWVGEGADDGPVLAQRAFSISEADNAESLYRKIEHIASDLIREFLPQLASGDPPGTPQDHSCANTWRRRDRLDGLIDFRMSSQNIDRLVRALTRPYVGAHTVYRGCEIKVWRTRIEHLPSNLENAEYGKVLRIQGREIWVRSGDGAIVVAEHEFSELPPVGDYIR